MATATNRPVWTLGDYLWKSRTDAGFQQKEMAAELGVSRQLVGRWEDDESYPTTKQVSEWARLTNVTVAWLMEPLELTRRELPCYMHNEPGCYECSTAELMKGYSGVTFAHAASL